jgi:ankyrin repeat protein
MNATEVKQLLALGADPNEGAPLVAAASNRDASTIAALLEAGADVDGADDGGNTALNVAAESCFDEGIKLLSSAGANWLRENAEYVSASDALSWKCSENATSGSLSAVLRNAVRTKDDKEVTRVLALGADPNERDTGVAPLLMAALNFDAPTMRALLKGGAAVDIFDTWGNTALMISADACFEEGIEVLAKAGARWTLENRASYSARDALPWNCNVTA